MNSKHLIAAATLAIAATGASAAGSMSGAPVNQEVWAGPTPVAMVSDTSRQVSRAEVQADWNLWQMAGLGQYQVGEGSPAADPLYAQRLAEYQRMRSGPEYVAEVRRLGGETSAVASVYESRTVPMTN
ncbi:MULTISPECIES: hypothetical protein [unclassified Acidovorax]|uniref:hypothetical protein n=1 Tax=unclassified Acidovorax TaxID=2684926 RepID=UPI0028831F6C|nr:MULTISPECIES: hypothetical protein [unclassified Acidovorax]